MWQETFKKEIFPLSDKLYRLAFSITGNKGDAEDTVQDVFTKLWQTKETLKRVDNLPAYCFRMVRNLAIDKTLLKDNQQLTIPEGFDFPESGKDVQTKIEEEEQLNQLDSFLEQLPEKQRTIFQLREIEEMSYKEIAEIVQITEEQVKIHLFRTRQKVKEYFINNYK
jgi:RNA polymerase sigma factor, sigma-70 family